MMKKTSDSSPSSPSPRSGATDSLWQPSWLHWLISALSGTVEIEKETARLKQENAKLREQNAKLREQNAKLDEIDRKYATKKPGFDTN
jgi:cell shape-determining protein MreC